MGRKKPITYDEALTEAVERNTLLVCKGKSDGSDFTAVGYYALKEGAMWLRVVDVNKRRKELEELEFE